MTELTQLWIRVRLVLKVSFEPANLLAKNVTAYTNANGHVTTYAYDSNGNVLTTTDASFLDAARQLSDWIMITDGSAGKCN